MTNTSSSSTSSPDSSQELVQVVLSGCSAADADVVLDALGAGFASDGEDRAGGDGAGQGADGGPDVWTGSFLARQDPDPLPGADLADSVTAELQGSPVAVNQVRKALETVFEVESAGSVSGDQEVELQLRLTTSAKGA